MMRSTSSMCIMTHSWPQGTHQQHLPLPVGLLQSSPKLPVCFLFVSSSRPSLSRSLHLHTSPHPQPSCSSSHIFLTHLKQHEDEEEEEEEEEEEGEKGDDDDDEEKEEENGGNLLEDPVLEFFKSRTFTEDPHLEGRFQLQQNRRSAWHLSPHMEEAEENVEEAMSSLSSKQEEEEGGRGVPGEILRIAKDLPANSTLGEMLESFEGKVSAKDCLDVLKLMDKEGLATSAIYFFEWMGLQEPTLVTPRACSLLFPLLGRAGMGDQLLLLFHNLPRKKGFQDVRVYNAVLSGLMNCARFDDALKVYEGMEANNIQPDHVTCSIIITVMRRNGRGAKDVWELFLRMDRKGITLSSEVLGALIKSFCDEGLKKEALIIQSEMEKRGIPSNIIIYNSLMDAYCKSNQIEEAEGLFAEIKAKGLKYTSPSFNILMDAYSRRMQPEIVEKLLLEMQEMGLKPDVTSYTCLISAYGRQKKMSDSAADAFLRMRKLGIRPNSHSYTAFIHAYSVAGWHEKAYTAFENMLRERIKPSIETYTTLLDAFRRAGDVDMLRKLWKMMIKEKIEGTRVTFNILLDGFAKKGLYVEARDVISEYGKIGLHPTVMTYNILMNGYARGGQHSRLPQLLKEMAALNLKPDSVTYSTMIYAYVRVRDFKRAFFYHKMMVKSGQVPDPKSYEKLREILDVKVAIKNRKDRSAILGIVNSKFGSLKPKKKRKKDEFWKNKKRHPRTHNFSPVVPCRS